MNVVMIEQFIFESSGAGLRGCGRVGPRSLSSRGSIRQIASTRPLCRYRLGQELRHPQQAVAADREHRHEAGTAITAHPHLAHGPSVLAPAEGFFDALADALAGSIAAVARGTRIDRGAAGAGDVLCHVRSDAQRATLGHEL